MKPNPSGVVSVWRTLVKQIKGLLTLPVDWYDASPLGLGPLPPMDPRVAAERGNPGLTYGTASRFKSPLIELDQRVLQSLWRRASRPQQC